MRITIIVSDARRTGKPNQIGSQNSFLYIVITGGTTWIVINFSELTESHQPSTVNHQGEHGVAGIYPCFATRSRTSNDATAFIQFDGEVVTAHAR